MPQGSKIHSIISVAGNQVIRNLSEPSEFTLMHLDTYADYLRQLEPRTESRAVQALLTTGGPRMKKLHGRSRGLWAVSSDAERGWNQYLHQDLCNNR